MDGACNLHREDEKKYHNVLTGRSEKNVEKTKHWRLVIIREPSWKCPDQEAGLLTTKHQFRIATYTRQLE
jgi:hypothetical protein